MIHFGSVISIAIIYMSYRRSYEKYEQLHVLVLLQLRRFPCVLCLSRNYSNAKTSMFLLYGVILDVFVCMCERSQALVRSVGARIRGLKFCVIVG